MRYQIGTITNLGKKRSSNQDNYLARTGSGGTPCALLVVADGMGGLSDGDVASGLVVAEMQKWWDALLEKQAEPDEISRSLDEVIYRIHREIYAYEQEKNTRTGTTLSLVFLLGTRYLVKHVGDSRIYLCTTQKTVQLTEDQNWYNREVEAGRLENARLADNRTARALVNALGPSRELEIRTQRGCIKRGEALLLCTDGFYGCLKESLTARRWPWRYEPQQVLEAMLQEILTGPAGDNITAVLCRLPYWG